MPHAQPSTQQPPPRGRAYLVYSGLVISLSFLLLYPFFLLCMLPGLQRLSVGLNWLWCRIFFPLTAQRVQVQWQAPLPHGPVVYVANHSSYLDIPLLTNILPGFICFIGKHSLGRVPLFGLYFRQFHISVNRGDRQDRARSLQQAKEKLKQGRPLVVFPEGTIHQPQPRLYPFKDGAFRAAIHAQVPIVPITIGYNWCILPDDGSFVMRRRLQQVTVHAAWPTTGLADENAANLRDQVHATMAAELKRLNPQHYLP